MSDRFNELELVERPLVEQLVGLGWRRLPGDTGVPANTGREGFRDALLKDRLRAALRRINPTAGGEEWLDDARLSACVSRLELPASTPLLEANRAVTDFLLNGTTVEGDVGGDAGAKNQTVRYIDFDRPENNDFLVVDQFRVEAVGREPVIPDVVLFVNGIPLVVIECKSPAITDPVEAGVDQLLRYCGRREGVRNEGVEKLFHPNQLLVSTCSTQARFAALGAGREHYLEWKTTSPVPEANVAAALGVDGLTAGQTLAAGMLRPENLLRLLRDFVLFTEVGGSTVKLVPRYQQFRAVNRAIERLATGKTRLEDGDVDRRGGVIWHTQGSGKSLTMVFLIRAMRSTAKLRRFKIVVVTDRADLEEQLSATAALTGEPMKRARSSAHLKELLREPGSGLVFAMIQKVQDDADKYPVLDESDESLLLVDEAHRSQSNTLHANLRRALPNAARIGFTGTPLLAAEKKPTEEIFGPFIDRYTIRESEEDEATVPILYEGRTADAAVSDGRSLDELFEDMFDLSGEELEAVKRKYAAESDVLEAEKLIAAKARDILRHYIQTVLPNGFKAQLVATSRLAVVRYRDALDEALREITGEIEAGEGEFARAARPHLETIKSLRFAAVISGRGDDPPEYAEWTDATKQRDRIARFKRPLAGEDPEESGDKADGLAFLCVKSMLLTGFDAPTEQVLYLDRKMRGHELLQAIARVNRTAPGKTHGLVVDYYGVARHLEEALDMYAGEDRADAGRAMKSLADELPRLEARHLRARAPFEDHGLDIHDFQPCLDLLRDTSVRADFSVRLGQFLESLEVVLPRPEALPFVPDAKTLGFLNRSAANLYRDSQLSIFGAGAKVRDLIDAHITANGVDPKVPPVSILDAHFYEAVASRGSDRAKASEMEHAARHHIEQRMNEDPAHYRKLSERLEGILDRLEDNWGDLLEELRRLTEEIRAGRPADDSGLDPETQKPFLGLLIEDPAGESLDLPADRLEELALRAVELVDLLRGRICVRDFWRNDYRQSNLRNEVHLFLDDNDLVPFERQAAVADEVVDLARHLHHRLCP